MEKKETTIRIEVGNGFYFGWTFGLGTFVATILVIFVLKILEAMGIINLFF